MFLRDNNNIVLIEELKTMQYISDKNNEKFLFYDSLKISEEKKCTNKDIIDKKKVQKNIKKEEENLKRKRKLKNSGEKRNYKCWCGKEYFSNAALYTHKKIKHKDNISNKQNSPVRIRKKKTSFNISKENIKKINNFNQRFSDYINEFDKINTDKINVDLINLFPCDIFVEKKFYCQILIKVEKLRIELKNNFGNNYLKDFHIILSQVSNLYYLKCNEIFAIFILYSFQYTSAFFYKEIIFILICLKELLNEKGWEKYKNFGLNKSTDFCNSQTAEFIPDFFNTFVFYHLEECFKNGNIIKNTNFLNYFGIESKKLLRVIEFLKFFGEWLKIYSFTTAKVDFVNSSINH